MESNSSPDSGAGHCVTTNGLMTSSDSVIDPPASRESLHTEVAALRGELSKKQDLLVKLQDRERQLRERFLVAIRLLFALFSLLTPTVAIWVQL